MNPPAMLATTEDAALAVAQRHMSRVYFYQIGLFLGPAAALAASSALWLSGVLPAAATIAINAVAQYWMFTVMHDGAHGVACRASTPLRLASKAFAHVTAWLYLIPFSCFKFAHLGHHHSYNDPTRDPDHWVAGRNPLSVIARCASMHIPYYGVILKKAPLAERRDLFIYAAALLTLIVVSIATNTWLAVLVIWLIPAHIALFLVAFAFDWASHHPHHEKVFGDSVGYLFPKPWHRIVALLWVNQHLHLIHHLYPRVPWTRVETLFHEIRPYLEARGAVIRDYSGETSAALNKVAA